MALQTPTSLKTLAALCLCLATLHLGACAEGSSSSYSEAICGNGVLEAGEACDDGNMTPGDGCNSRCDLESGACGNAVVEAGEDCDDGNGDLGDGCTPECELESGGCGDGALNSGEECDDGNTTSGDGCSDSCRGECGNGTRDGTEECDDGNTATGDGCSADCKLEGDGPYCGNGVKEGQEECDDANALAGDGCTASCTLEAGACGDGTLNTGESCDDGNNLNNDGCDSACALEGAVCGNGTMETGEECEDGNTTDFDGCSHLCKTERCGDGVLQPNEQCEDGNVTPNDGCSATCQSEQTIVCGNGIQETGEGCDDNNLISGDGCSSACVDEQTGICTPNYYLACDSVDSWDTTFAGSTNEIEQYSCVPWAETGREYTYSFVAPSSSAVRLSLAGLTSDLDIFVIGGSECVDENCTSYGDDEVTFDAIEGQTYDVVVDGYLGAEGPYSLSLECGACGDGTVDPSEECDDGNTNDGDGCDASCREEAGVCVPVLEVACNTYDDWATTLAGSTDKVDGYSCNTWTETGREYAYYFAPTTTTSMTVTLTPEVDVDLDLFLLQDDGNGVCQSGECSLVDDDTISATFNAGEVYWIVVDGFLGDEGSYNITFECP